MSELPQEIEGALVVPPGARFAIVAARFNELVVDQLADGARKGLRRHGVKDDAITTVRVPGAWDGFEIGVRAILDGTRSTSTGTLRSRYRTIAGTTTCSGADDATEGKIAAWDATT